jgi:Ca2+-binding RTX toxin-like protein
MTPIRTNTIYGTLNDDTILATDLNEVIFGGAGSDIIIDLGISSDDLFIGNRGDDFILSLDGEDDIFGDKGNDTIDVQGDDFVWIDGGSGKDRLSLADHDEGDWYKVEDPKLTHYIEVNGRDVAFADIEFVYY